MANIAYVDFAENLQMLYPGDAEWNELLRASSERDLDGSAAVGNSRLGLLRSVANGAAFSRQEDAARLQLCAQSQREHSGQAKLGCF